MQDGIKPAKSGVESAILDSNPSTSDREVGGRLGQTHLGNIGHNNELELIFVFPKHFSKMGSFGCGPDRGSDGVAFFEEGVDDVDGGETVRAGDKDFASWSDGWHVSQVWDE